MMKMATLAALGSIAFAMIACGNSDSGSLNGGSLGDPGAGPSTNDNPGAGGTPPGTPSGSNGADPNAQNNPNIDQRKINYGEALRTASLKLVGELPMLVDINAVADSSSTATKAAYESKIDALLADPRFVARQIQWWRDTLKTGQPGVQMKQGMPSYDTAATFATEVVVNDRPFTDLFTATSNTCPTYASGAFVDANCGGNGPTAGVLTDPGLMSQYFANMAFRRVRFVQETFVCSKYPAEFSSTPAPMGSGVYTSPWNFNSITGGAGPTVKVNFQDTSSVVCANCHSTMNHQAPLFAHFDMNGVYQPAIAVKVPSTGTPTAVIADWLPNGETFAWRNGTVVTDLPSFGKAVAADPDVARCIVTREWNYAMGRGDVVNDLATVPPVVTDALVKDFSSNGFKVKRLLRNIFTADDFVKF